MWERLAGPAFTGGAWSLAIYGNGRHGHRVLLKNGSCSSERVQHLGSGFVPVLGVRGGSGRDSGSGAAAGHGSPLCACFGCVTCSFVSVVSEKQLRVLLNRVGRF